MTETLKQIFEANSIEVDDSGERHPLHSNTSLGQCLFIEEMFDAVKPQKTLEIGLAMGLSAISILEKHKENGGTEKCHIVSEPHSWKGIAEHNIEKLGLMKYCDIRYLKSDRVVTDLFLSNERIQLAYIDTTKVVDIVMQDFYFIDKILDIGGVIILDDCGGGWPGIQKVARFANTLPHYKIAGKYGKAKRSFKLRLYEKAVAFVISLIPFKQRIFTGYSFKTNHQLGLDYNCIAFKKISEDKRDWSWDEPW